MAIETPKASIIMNVNNEFATLERSLPVLFTQTSVPPWELIVLDSGSTDGSDRFVAKYADRYPNVRLVRVPPEEFHHARTRSQGLDLARGEVAVFLAGDALPAGDNWLASLLAPLEQDEKLAGVYGRQIPRENADTFNRLRNEWNFPDKALVKDRDTPRNLSGKERAFFSTANCCVHLGRVGQVRFDESLPVNEDVGLSWKLLHEGWKLAYSPKAAVIHSHNRSPLEILRRYFDNAVTYRQIGIHGRGDQTLLRDAGGFGVFLLRRLQGESLLEWVRVGMHLFGGGLGLLLGRLEPWLPRPFVRWISAYGVG